MAEVGKPCSIITISSAIDPLADASLYRPVTASSRMWRAVAYIAARASLRLTPFVADNRGIYRAIEFS